MIGEKLVKLREKKGWSQRELANRAGLNFSVMNRIEGGKRAVTDQEITIFADIFDVTTDYLLGRSEKVVPDLSDDEKEMMAFFKNPKLNLFFKEMADSPEEQIEELRDLWEFVKKRGLNKK